nr:hypothetical protein Iba_chr07eCG7590 [Ipomoea batatas]
MSSSQGVQVREVIQSKVGPEAIEVIQIEVGPQALEIIQSEVGPQALEVMVQALEVIRSEESKTSRLLRVESKFSRLLRLDLKLQRSYEARAHLKELKLTNSSQGAQVMESELKSPSQRAQVEKLIQ